MLFHCFLRKGVVYVPTVVRLETGAYMDVEPIGVAAVADTDAIRRPFLAAIDKGVAVNPKPTNDIRTAPAAVLKYAGAKSWSAFMRGAATWSIQDGSDTRFKIVGYKTHPKGYWTEDRNQDIEFPIGSTADDVIDRMIAILQDAARC